MDDKITETKWTKHVFACWNMREKNWVKKRGCVYVWKKKDAWDMKNKRNCEKLKIWNGCLWRCPKWKKRRILWCIIQDMGRRWGEIGVASLSVKTSRKKNPVNFWAPEGRQKADPRSRTDGESWNRRTQKQVNDNEADERIKPERTTTNQTFDGWYS